jgi:hypothetical protein
MRFLGILFFFTFSCCFSQENNEDFTIEYDSLDLNGTAIHTENFGSEDKYIAYKSLAAGKQGKLHFDCRAGYDITQLSIVNTVTNATVLFEKKGEKYQINLPAAYENYDLEIKNGSAFLGRIKVLVFQPKTYRIKLIPNQFSNFNVTAIEKELDRAFGFAQITFKIELVKFFAHNKDEYLLDNPNLSRNTYTNQMQSLRNRFLKSNLFDDQIATYFMVNGFVNDSLSGFSVKNKSLGFLKNGQPRPIANAILSEFVFGYAGLSDSLAYAGSRDGFKHNELCWQQLRAIPATGSFYDDYENVVTNNGIVAFYLWKSKKDGSIEVVNGSFKESIGALFKKNTYSYHLELKHFFYRILFSIKSYQINLFHFIAFFLVGFFWWKARRWWKKSSLYLKIDFSFILKALSRMLLLVVSVLLLFLFWFAIEKGYSLYEVRSGPIVEYEGLKKNQVIQQLNAVMHPKKKSENQIGTEIIVQTRNKYLVRHVAPVCYFKAVVNDKKKIVWLKFVTAKNELELKDQQPITAQSHYQVIDLYSASGMFLEQKVYNHLGSELTQKLKLVDVPKRILLFVNGYRPTSLSNSLEKNIADIEKKGLEYPDSYNHLYDYDRYNYWRPWSEIDLQFSKRLNPTESYYADGHHSVETSNHQSLLNFSTTSAIYPKRCKYSKKHVCYHQKTVNKYFFGSDETSTYELHKMQANTKGFKIRRKAGEIAGRNLLQLLNELPNGSKNDTLYIIAHSMGFAYSLGLIDELRGKIHFGSFFIIAPENASAGIVNRSEWKSVFQYGSNFNAHGKDAPCLLDGVAPQVKVGGLLEKDRLYIPASNFQKKGFFDSHFIGYYNWILGIASDQRGALKQY